MSSTLIAEQLLNGLQFGLMLFLIAAGLTLVAVARPDGFEVFSRADRIDWPEPISGATPDSIAD